MPVRSDCVAAVAATNCTTVTATPQHDGVGLRSPILSSLGPQMAEYSAIYRLGALLPATVRFRHFNCRASGSTIKETSDDRGTAE